LARDGGEEETASFFLPAPDFRPATPFFPVDSIISVIGPPAPHGFLKTALPMAL
jgi:hypothetical protein